MKKRHIFSLILTIIFLIGIFSLINSFDQNDESVEIITPPLQIKADPFSIDNDVELASYASTGSGTSSSPYILFGWSIINPSGNPTYGIRIQDTTKHFILSNCEIRGISDGSASGIILYNVRNGKVSANTVSYCYHGISVVSSSYDCELNGNNVHHNSYDNIYISGSHDIDLINNIADYATSYDGIRLSNADNCYFYKNYARYCSDDGVTIGSGSDNNIFFQNYILHNYGDGFYIYSSDGNDLNSNDIEYNDYGVYISGSDCQNNIIRYNNFTGNSYSAIVDYGTDTSTYGNSGTSQSEPVPDPEPTLPTLPILDEDTWILIGLMIFFGAVIAVCAIGSYINKKYQEGKGPKPKPKKSYTPPPKYPKKSYRTISDIIADMERRTPIRPQTTPTPTPAISKPIKQVPIQATGDYVIVNKVRIYVQKKKLDLSGRGINSISEIIGLNRLNYLEEIDLSDNNISEIEDLKYLPNLTYLNFYKNNIPKIKGLDSLHNLEYLYLSNNEISEIEGLDNLKNLEMLTLAKNQIEEIKGLDNLSNLRHLNLRSNRIRNIKGLQNLTNLKRIWLQENPIDQIENHLINASTTDIIEHCREKSPEVRLVPRIEEKIPIEIVTEVPSIFDEIDRRSTQIDTRQQKKYFQKIKYEEEPDYVDQIQHEEEPDYVDQIQHEEEPDYVDQIQHEEEPDYVDQIQHEEEPDYVDQIQYEEEPDYVDQIKYEEEPDYLEKIIYAKEPKYVDKIEYKEPKYEDKIDLEQYNYERNRIKESVVQLKPKKIAPEKIKDLTESYFESLSSTSHEDILNELQSEVTKDIASREPLFSGEGEYESVLPETNFSYVETSEETILPESNFGVVGKHEGSMLDDSEFSMASNMEEKSIDEVPDILKGSNIEPALLSEQNPLTESIIPPIELEYSQDMSIPENIVGSAFGAETQDEIQDILRNEEFEKSLISKETLEINHEIPELVIESHVPEISGLSNLNPFDEHAQSEMSVLSDILSVPISSFESMSGVEFDKLEEISSASTTFEEMLREHEEGRRQSDQRQLEIRVRQESFRTTAAQAKNIYVYYKDEKIEVKNNVLHLRRRGITSLKQIKGLEKLTDLEELNLYQNDLTSISGLDNLKNLKILNLGENKLSFISGLDNLESLEVLLLDNNIIRKISGLYNLIFLKKLDLRGNKIRKIEGLKELKDLEYLDLSNNEIRVIEGIKYLINLKTFICEKNPINVNDKQMLLQSAQRIVDYVKRKESKASAYY